MAQGPKDDESGFFNRWSQRKQQATREEMPQPSAEKAPESDVPRPEDVPSAAPELTEDELAALPAIDDLTPPKRYPGIHARRRAQIAAQRRAAQNVADHACNPRSC